MIDLKQCTDHILKTNVRIIQQILFVINYIFILMDLCNKNLNFNQVQNFSSQIRFGKDDTNALKRMDSLKESKTSICEILNEAQATNKKLIIKSFIEIEYED